MAKFKRGDLVKKKSGSEWQGIVCGEYSTELTPEGYAVESESHAGSVQIYPANALEFVNDLESKTMNFQIWSEGYLVSGMEGIPEKARMLAEVEAETFQEACDKLCGDQDWQRLHGNYNAERLTVWGCRLFDNETDARKSFG